MEIWIVHGTAGEYSDRGEWIVDAWPSREAAQARVEALEALALKHGYRHGSGPAGSYSYEQDRAMREKFIEESGDKRFSADYTGTTYFYSSCELHK